MYHDDATREPLYAQIKRDLLAKIERGTWPLHQQIPTEDDLLKHYEVSRGTVRRALFELELEGYLRRLSGKGTFVSRVLPKLHRAPGEITAFSQQLAHRGFDPVTKVLDTGVIPASAADGRVAAGFGIPPNTEVIMIKRLRGTHGLPYAIQTVYLLPEQCPEILAEDLTHLFQLYAKKYARKIVAADESIQGARALMDEATLLDLPPGTPVLIRDRVSFDQHGDPFEVLHSVDRGDLFAHRYVIVNDLAHRPWNAEEDPLAQRLRGHFTSPAEGDTELQGRS